MKRNIMKAILLVGFSTIIANSAIALPSEFCSVIGIQEPDGAYDGPTSCGEVELTSLVVRGPLQLTDTKVHGKTTVSGPIRAIGATLQEVDLEKNFSVETFTLQSSTVVNGDITFIGKEGIVYVDSSSKINGKVINGKVVYQSINSQS